MNSGFCFSRKVADGKRKVIRVSSIVAVLFNGSGNRKKKIQALFALSHNSDWLLFR